MKIILILILALSSCSDPLGLFPNTEGEPDQFLPLPNGDEMALYCDGRCANQALILRIMDELTDGPLFDEPEATYPHWAKYSITWSDREKTSVGDSIHIYYPNTEQLEESVRLELMAVSTDKIRRGNQ